MTNIVKAEFGILESSKDKLNCLHPDFFSSSSFIFLSPPLFFFTLYHSTKCSEARIKCASHCAGHCEPRNIKITSSLLSTCSVSLETQICKQLLHSEKCDVRARFGVAQRRGSHAGSKRGVRFRPWELVL